MGAISLLFYTALALVACVATAEDVSLGADGTNGEATPQATPLPPALPRDASKLLSAGEREFRAKKVDVSVRLLGEALAAATATDVALKVKILYARHKSFVSLSRLPAAVADLTSALELDPKYVLAFLMRANLQLMSGRCAEATTDYRRVLELDPAKRDAAARLPHAEECTRALERADFGKKHGQHQVVRQALTEAMLEGRATQAPALLLARAEAAIANGGEGDLEEALADLAKVIKTDSNNVKAYATRGRALVLHGDFATGE
jgi:tetratricopeptide (TPR) repeat protein